MATNPQPEAFVRWFRQTAPYLHAFGGRTFVVAFGGELVTDRARFTHFIQDINLLAALGIRLVLVHGARPQIEAALKSAGQRSRFAKGQRITDQAALVAVKHAAGALRVELEALLSQGLPNSPMAGADIRVASGNYITARPMGIINGVDLHLSTAENFQRASFIKAVSENCNCIFRFNCTRSKQWYRRKRESIFKF